jgi:TRAP-type transport system periplasmic protein
MKRIIGSTLFIVALTVIFFVTGSPLSAQDKVIKLRYSDFAPPSHSRSKLTAEWCKEIEKRTNGRISVTYFPGGTLTPPGQTYDSVTKGIADIGSSLMSYSAGRFPLSEVLSLPLGFKDGHQATKLAYAYYKKFQPKEFADTKVMMLYAGGHCSFMTVKPIGKTEDLKGLRIKANAENADIARAVGAAPVTMPVTETYDSLQKGLLDGILLSVDTLKSYRLGELLKSVLENHAFSYGVGLFVTMNKAKWESMPKDLQQIVEAVNDEYIDKYGKVWAEGEKEGLDYGISKGLKVIRVSKEEQAKWAEKMKPVFDDYIKMTKSKGLPGDEVVKFCQEYIKANP